MGTVEDAYDNAMAECFLPAWNVNSSLGGAGKPRPKHAWPCLPGSKLGTTPYRRHPASTYLLPNNFERKHTEKIIDTENQIIPEPYQAAPCVRENGSGPTSLLRGRRVSQPTWTIDSIAGQSCIHSMQHSSTDCRWKRALLEPGTTQSEKTACRCETSLRASGRI